MSSDALSGPPAPECLAFGPFTLFPAERRLERKGAPVRLGGRALDLLVALASAAGEVLGKKALIARVWPDTVVEEGSLRFHLVAVRKALADGGSGIRYIDNIASRGYCFVCPVVRSGAAGVAAAQPVPRTLASRTLPASAASVVGREDAIALVVEQLKHGRFVTIVGPGGMGKTTVAIASAHALLASLDADATFTDLSLIGDGDLVGPTIAAAMGLTLNAGDVAAGIAAHLAPRRTLLVLDCCEHVIDAVAMLAERLVKRAPEVHVLVTSREALRVEGEFVYRLAPLAYPAAGENPDAAAALGFAAVRLFVDRAASSGSGYALSDADAPLVAKLCRELDGIALAIELAAGRLEAYGLRGIVDLLDRRMKLMWHGRRTAVPRQQTLGATLDWSHNLLSQAERIAFRRLSVFVGGFSLEAASFVVAMDDMSPPDATEAIAKLVGKSLLNVDAGGRTLRYALLDTTREYAAGKLQDSGETRAVGLRHARHFADWLAAETPGGTQADEIGNLRAALDACLGDARDPELGYQLAAAASRIFLARSLLLECTRWTTLALGQRPAEARADLRELTLCAALGQALTFTGGSRIEIEKAFARALAIAAELQDRGSEFRILNGLAMARHRAGDFRGALATAQSARAVAVLLGDADASAMSESLLGVALHMVGQAAQADVHWQAVMARGARADRLETIARFGFDHYVRALCGRARSLWLRGEYEQAVAEASRAIGEAETLGHTATLCIALIWAGAVFIWNADQERTAGVIDKLSAQAHRHSLGPYLAIAEGLRGELLILRGQAEAAIPLLRECLAALRANHYEMPSTGFVISLAVALSRTGLRDDALATCEQAICRIDAAGDRFYLPDALYLKGMLLGGGGAEHRQQAAAQLAAAAEMAASQGARAWQTRALGALEALRLDQETPPAMAA